MDFSTIVVTARLAWRESGTSVKATAVDPLAFVYHELRSPLGLVVTAAQSAAEETDDEDVRRRCQAIVRAAERMLRTASQVFEVAQARQAGAARPYSPHGIVRDLVADLSGLDVRVRLLVNEGVAPLQLHGVPEQFEALVHCLVSNAVDHSDPGSQVLVGLSLRDGDIELTVTNHLASRSRHHGLGLGSYLASQLAAGLGATILTRAEEGLYAVAVRLPVGVAPATYP